MDEKEKIIDSEWMKKLEKGELDEERAKMLLEKEWTGLGLFAWENRMVLTHEPGTFAIETTTDVYRTDLEKKHKAKFLVAEVKENVIYCLMKKWGDINIEVNVWNLQAGVIFRDDEGNLSEYECNEEIQGKLDELAYSSVYDAGGVINRSGLYPPNDELIKFFRDSITKGNITVGGR